MRGGGFYLSEACYFFHLGSAFVWLLCNLGMHIKCAVVLLMKEAFAALFGAIFVAALLITTRASMKSLRPIIVGGEYFYYTHRYRAKHLEKKSMKLRITGFMWPESQNTRQCLIAGPSAAGWHAGPGNPLFFNCG